MAGSQGPYAQKKGLIIRKTCKLIVKMTTIKIVLTIATNCGWRIHQMFIMNAFSSGWIDEEVYMEL